MLGTALDECPRYREVAATQDDAKEAQRKVKSSDWHPPAVWNLLERAKLIIALLEYIWRPAMNGLIYLIGLIVVIMIILSFLGLH